MNIIRWGIIGCGDVTEKKSGPAFQKVEGFTLDAVMRRDKILLRDYANRHNVKKYYSDADELINDKDIDAIYIATPPNLHKFYALKVAEVYKICCIEKPLAPTYNDSKQIVEAFEKINVPLFVSYYRRSLPRYNKVKKLLDNGTIGKIRHINWILNKAPTKLDLSKKENWRTKKEIALGGYFDDLASHGLDLFSYLIDDYDEVFGTSAKQQNLYTALDSISACWKHKNNVTGSGNWTFSGYSEIDTVIIYGSEGEVEFSIYQDKPIVLTNKNGIQKFYIKNHKNVQYHHIKNMQKHLLNEITHPSMGQSALSTSLVMDKILGKIID